MQAERQTGTQKTEDRQEHRQTETNTERGPPPAFQRSPPGLAASRLRFLMLTPPWGEAAEEEEEEGSANELEVEVVVEMEVELEVIAEVEVEVKVFLEAEVAADVPAVPTAEQGVEERMGKRGVMRKGVSLPSASLRNVTSFS